VKDHPDWLLRDEYGQPVPAGVTWGGVPWALDSSHPGVLDWLDKLIRKVTGWGYAYLKLDFLYQGALGGKRYDDISREEAYRKAMQVMREAADNAYVLACGAPVIPSLGLCDGIRIGPDVTNFWVNQALTTWLNNPNESSTANAIRTCIHRAWLKPLANVDPDVMYFRTKYNALKPNENQLLQDLGTITGFKATSDLPQWWKPSEREMVREYLGADPMVRKKKRYQYQINERDVDFGPAIPIPTSHMGFPVWLAKNLGFLKILWHQVLPAILTLQKR
jgi:alpha-galactosidase